MEYLEDKRWSHVRIFNKPNSLLEMLLTEAGVSRKTWNRLEFHGIHCDGVDVRMQECPQEKIPLILSNFISNTYEFNTKQTNKP